MSPYGNDRDVGVAMPGLSILLLTFSGYNRDSGYMYCPLMAMIGTLDTSTDL